MNALKKKENQAGLTGVGLIAISEEISLYFPRPISRTLVTLMEVDPYTVHAYWNITPSVAENIRGLYGDDILKQSMILRCYLLRPDTQGSARNFFDLKIQGLQSSIYVKVDAQSAYLAEIGFLAPDNAFFELARSNDVFTPPDYRSFEESDQEGKEKNKNADTQEVISAPCEISGADMADIVNADTDCQGSFYTFSKDLEKGIEANVEFRVFGRVDGKTALTVAGEPVRIRPDGSFSHRIGLKDKEEILSRLNIGVGQVVE